ncbi:DNA polymerase III subunit beta [Martelella sp. AMO21009]
MFTAEKSALLSALETANSAVERRNTIPILANVLFERADDPDRLTLRATDLDIEITVSFAADAAEGFEPFTVSAAMLLSIVKSLPDGAITIANADAKANALQDVTVKSGRSKFRLPVLPAEDFPTLPEMTAKPITVDAQPFRQALVETAFAMAGQKEDRVYLKGVHLHRRADDIALVASNGHLLTVRVIDSFDSPADLPGIIISDKMVGILAKALPETGTISLRIDDRRISAEIGNRTITAKLVEATYPEYPRLIAAGLEDTITVERKKLLEASKRVGLVLTAMSQATVLTFAEGLLTIEAADREAGDASEDLEIDGEIEARIGVKQQYLAGALDHMPGARIAIHTGAGAGQIRLTSPDGHADDLIVIMLMRV